jgi:hypothetical protein
VRLRLLGVSVLSLRGTQQVLDLPAVMIPAWLLYATMTPLFHQTWGELNDRHGIWMSGTGPSTSGRLT